MSKKPSRTKSTDAETLILATTPWSCTHFGNQSEIETLLKATRKWKTIADVHAVGGLDAEDIADFIIRVVNDYAISRRAIAQAMKEQPLIKSVKLSPRELEILTLTAYGKERGDIAAALSISEETVKSHMDHVLQKMGAANKTHAAVLACIHGVIKL